MSKAARLELSRTRFTPDTSKPSRPQVVIIYYTSSSVHNENIQ